MVSIATAQSGTFTVDYLPKWIKNHGRGEVFGKEKHVTVLEGVSSVR